MPVPIAGPTTPGQSRAEYAVDEVLRASVEPAASVMRRRPPVPTTMFPDRQGFVRVQPTIEEVLSLKRSNTSGYFSGSVEPSIGLRNTTGGD